MSKQDNDIQDTADQVKAVLLAQAATIEHLRESVRAARAVLIATAELLEAELLNIA